MMVIGTSSHAGKSWMATAICRRLRRRGVRVAPFKAQNMSLNSYPCRGGGEIGRSQAAQAEACGLDPRSDMNPILLKPTSDGSCQVIVNGKVWQQVSAREHYRHYDFLLQQVLAAYQRLAEEFEFIVMEGAGGAAEINLRKTDLVNLPLAVRVNAPALLVADIDRGGVFASVAGTFALLEPDEKELVRSFAVNRFRGDPSFFASGRSMLEQRVERRCLGVFPYQDDVWLDPEDSVCLDEASVEQPSDAQLRVVIIRLPHISNFTDFRLLPGRAIFQSPSRATSIASSYRAARIRSQTSAGCAKQDWTLGFSSATAGEPMYGVFAAAIRCWVGRLVILTGWSRPSPEQRVSGCCRSKRACWRKKQRESWKPV